MLTELHQSVRLQMQSNADRRSAKLELGLPDIHVCSYKHFLSLTGNGEALENVVISEPGSIASVE